MIILPPDLEAWMITYVREQVRARDIDVEVSDKEPDTFSLPLARPLIVIRDDSGNRLDWTTFDRSLGATIIGGTKQDDRPIRDLSRLVAALMFDADLPLVDGTPIARVQFGGCNGPYRVTDPLDLSRKYLTAQYVVVGSA